MQRLIPSLLVGMTLLSCLVVGCPFSINSHVSKCDSPLLQNHPSPPQHTEPDIIQTPNSHSHLLAILAIYTSKRL